MKGHNVGRAGYAPPSAVRWYHPLTLFGRSEGDSEEVGLGLSRLCLLLPPGKSLRLVARNDDALGDGSAARLPAGVAAEHVARVRLLCDAGDLGEAASAFADALGLEECAPPEDDPSLSERASWVRLADGRLCASVPLLRPPDVTRIGWLDRLVHLPFPCRVAVTVSGLSPVAEEARLRHAARKVAAAQGAIMAAGGQGEHLQLDAGAEHTAILTRVQDPATRVHLLGISVSVFASDHATLQARVRRVKEMVRTLGAQPATGLCDQLPLYLATTAGGPALPRRHLYRALSPTVGTSWPGISHAPGHRSGDAIGVAVPGGELVRFDPFAEALTNSLINVVGSTGSGKTFWALQQAARTLRAGGRVTILAAAGPYLSLAALGSLCHVVPRPGEPLVVPARDAAVLFLDLSLVAGDQLRALVPDLFSTVWTRATNSERRDFLIVDEGWNLVLYGGAAEHVERIFRLGRQAGIYSAFLTQKLADLLRHPAAAAVYEQAATSFYFRQSDANLSTLRDLEDLSAAEMAALPHLPRILHKSADAFLITKEAERTRRGVVRLWSTPEDRLLFGSYPEEARTRAAAVARHGSLERAVAALT